MVSFSSRERNALVPSLVNSEIWLRVCRRMREASPPGTSQVAVSTVPGEGMVGLRRSISLETPSN